MRSTTTILLLIASSAAGFLGFGVRAPPTHQPAAHGGVVPPTLVNKQASIRPAEIPSRSRAPKLRLPSAHLALPAISYASLGMLTAGAISLVKPLAWQGVALVSGCVGFPILLMAGELIMLGGAGVAKAMGGAPTNDLRLTELARKAAAAVDVPAPQVFVVQSREPNAFAASGLLGSDTTVAVTTGLREVLTEEELGAVLAHEMGHLRHRDVVRNMHIATAAAGMGGIYELGRVLLRSKDKSNDKDESGGALVGLGLMGAGIVSQGVAHMLRLAASRTAELKADHAAAQAFGADAMVSALRKIETHAARRPADLRDGRAGRAYAHLMISDGGSAASKTEKGLLEKIGNALRTHPPTDERIEALEKSAAKGEVPRRAPAAAGWPPFLA